MEDQEIQLVHAFPRGKGEEVQVSIRKYKGKHYADLRIWFQGKNESTFYPTKKGISIFLEQIPELRKGMDRLSKAAEKYRFAKHEIEI